MIVNIKKREYSTYPPRNAPTGFRFGTAGAAGATTVFCSALRMWEVVKKRRAVATGAREVRKSV